MYLPRCRVVRPAAAILAVLVVFCVGILPPEIAAARERVTLDYDAQAGDPVGGTRGVSTDSLKKPSVHSLDLNANVVIKSSCIQEYETTIRFPLYKHLVDIKYLLELSPKSSPCILGDFLTR
jgi:hypothetical protein